MSDKTPAAYFTELRIPDMESGLALTGLDSAQWLLRSSREPWKLAPMHATGHHVSLVAGGKFERLSQPSAQIGPYRDASLSQHTRLNVPSARRSHAL